MFPQIIFDIFDDLLGDMFGSTESPDDPFTSDVSTIKNRYSATGESNIYITIKNLDDGSTIYLYRIKVGGEHKEVYIGTANTYQANKDKKLVIARAVRDKLLHKTGRFNKNCNVGKRWAL